MKRQTVTLQRHLQFCFYICAFMKRANVKHPVVIDLWLLQALYRGQELISNAFGENGTELFL